MMSKYGGSRLVLPAAVNLYLGPVTVAIFFLRVIRGTLYIYILLCDRFYMARTFVFLVTSKHTNTSALLDLRTYFCVA